MLKFSLPKFSLSKSKLFLICCLSFVIGTAIASFLPDKLIRKEIWWFGGVVGCLVILILFWNSFVETPRKCGASLRLLFLFSFFLFLGLWRYSVELPQDTPAQIWYYNGKEVKVIGVITNEPDVRQNNVRYTVETRLIASLQQNGKMVETHSNAPLRKSNPRDEALPRLYDDVSGKILVITNLYPAYNYGDELEMNCKLQRPEPFNDFAYDRYLARYDIYSLCYYPEIKKGETRRSASLRKLIFTKIFSLKGKMSRTVDYGMSEPQASLGKAIAWGDRKGMTKELEENFSRTGLSHIVAISGMNISILAVIMMNMFLGLGLWRRQAFYITTAFLVVYIILVGMPASAVRAGVMGFLVLFAINSGRLSKLINSLIFAAALMLFINPKLLHDDIGFQLSFLAILGIIYVYPVIEEQFLKIGWKKFKPARNILSITLAAQIFTLPIVAINFSIISLIVPLANLLVLWTMPVIMVIVLGVMPLSFILPGISFLIFFPAQLLLKFVIVVAELMAKLPYAYLTFNFKYAVWLAVLYYIAVFLVLIKLSEAKKDIAI